MSSPIGSNGNFKAVPNIPSDITLNQIHLLFPKGFEDILDYEIDSISNSVNIIILNDNNKENTIITLDENIFNPSKNNCGFPNFLIEQHYKYPKIDYLTDTRNRFIFNQNEIFYLCLQHRLTEFKKFKNAYANLISNDITAIRSFISYIPNKAYNAIQKEKNAYIILSIFDPNTKQIKIVNNSQCLGNILKAKAYIPRKAHLQKLLPTLPIHFSSESMGEKSKYVLHDYALPLYRSVGYNLTKDVKGNTIVQSLFPPKQNIPARNKTHVTADAYEVSDFEATSLFIQDYIPNRELNIYQPKDRCYRKSICVIHPILDNGKFLFGEGQASVDFVNTEVVVREDVTDQLEEVYVELNKQYISDGYNKIQVALNIKNEVLYLENCLSATLKHVQIVGTLGVQKLIFDVVRSAGNARVDSNTGLKMVTTCHNNLGEITLPTLGKTLKPDLVFGMNSFKAKGNGIILARAALAVELGLYKPKHASGLLNTLNIQEINDASDTLPEYSYTDNLGNKQTVQIGIVYARYTELCYVFKSYRKQSFSFESGRVLHSLKDNRLFHNIWENYIEEDYKNIVLELEQILLDKKDIFETNLPMYTVATIKKEKIFQNKDLVLNIRTSTESLSCLLDENWNKGFFLNLTANGGKVIRIPCAKTLKMFCTQTTSKMYMYPALLVIISRILNLILTNQMQLLFPKTDSNYAKNQTPVIQFYREIKGLLFSSEEAAVMLVQKLSRPEIPGFAFKQVTDWILPEKTCVVMCNKTYNRSIKDALGSNYTQHEKALGFWGMHIRAPSLWRKQLCALRIWNQDDFRIFLHTKYNINLEDYINPEFNDDIVLFSNDVLENSQSDVDGDHSTTFIPSGMEAQECIREYNDEHIVEAEKQWIKDYIEGEKGSNDDLILDGVLVEHKYTLYDVPLHDVKINSKETTTGFSTFLFRAITAKANIGVSTNDGWIFNMLLDLYQKYYELNNGKYQVNENSDVKDMYRLSENQRDQISFSYTRALQDFVVRGVKHTSNGSEDFEVLFLKNFWKDENSKDVFKLLTNDLKLDTLLASKMMFVVTWAADMNFLKACGGFLKLYNKGTLPTGEVEEALLQHDDFIQANTYFGMLLEPLYKLRKHAQTYTEAVSTQVSVQTVDDPLASLGF